MRCQRCGGRLFLEPEGDSVACFNCGERLWHRMTRMVDRLLEAVLILEAREQGLSRRNLNSVPGRPRPGRRGGKRGHHKKCAMAA
jgi:hypothetical protein